MRAASGVARAAALSLLLLAGPAACRRAPDASVDGAGRGAAAGAAAGAVAVDPASRPEAEALGREIFQLVDRAADFRGSHRGRPPTSYRQMGLDSLTPTMVRRLALDGDSVVVTVAYRRLDGRRVTGCFGGLEVLEEASLSDGRFTVTCSLAGGGTAPYLVGDSR